MTAIVNVSYQKAMREARERALRELTGVGFQDGKGDWIRVDRVDSAGRVFLKDAVTDEPTAVVERDGHSDLITSIATNAKARSVQAWTFLVPGEGDRLVINWPSVVLHSGRTIKDLLAIGISEGLLNPRPSGEAWT